MIDFLLAIVCGVLFFFLWWKIGVFITKKYAVDEEDKVIIISFWPLVLASIVGLIYGAGKLIILLIECRG